MAFSNLLALAAEGDRQSVSDVAEKNPWLKKYAEMGEDLEKLQPRVKGLYDDGSVEKVVTELERWRRWHQNDWVAHQSQAQQTRDLLAAAHAKVLELENRSDVDMTPEEIRSLVKESVQSTLTEAGIVDNKMLAASLTDLIEKQVKPQIEANSNGLANRFQNVYAKLTPKMLRHAKDFDGEELDVEAVFTHMEKMAKDEGKAPGQIDPVKAYNDMMGPRYEEKRTKDMDAKLVEAEKRGEQKGRVEARKEAGPPGRTMPVDGRGSVKLGPIQRMQMDRFGKPPEDGKEIKAPLGKGIIASKAAAEHFDKQNQAGAA